MSQLSRRTPAVDRLGWNYFLFSTAERRGQNWNRKGGEPFPLYEKDQFDKSRLTGEITLGRTNRARCTESEVGKISFNAYNAKYVGWLSTPDIIDGQKNQEKIMNIGTLEGCIAVTDIKC